MGYDMSTVITPEGEERAVAKASKAFHDACAVRDALPKGSRGQWNALEREAARQGTLDWDALPANATPEYRAAQSEVARLSDVLNDVRRSYFRLNVWGMGMVCTAMLNLGMAYEGAPHAPWPSMDWDGAAGRVVEALSENEDPAAYFAKYYEGQTFTDLDVEQAKAYRATSDAIRREHTAGGDTIPVHKFGSNDGWLVTPNECLNALARWHAASEGERQSALLAAGIDFTDDPGWERLWNRWLAYLELAAHCDGFEVR